MTLQTAPRLTPTQWRALEWLGKHGPSCDLPPAVFDQLIELEDMGFVHDHDGYAITSAGSAALDVREAAG